MNNYYFENIRPLAQLKRKNHKFFQSFVDAYSDFYAASVSLERKHEIETSSVLAFGLLSLVEHNDQIHTLSDYGEEFPSN